jgi:hypothetical protein
LLAVGLLTHGHLFYDKSISRAIGSFVSIMAQARLNQLLQPSSTTLLLLASANIFLQNMFFASY